MTLTDHFIIHYHLYHSLVWFVKVKERETFIYSINLWLVQLLMFYVSALASLTQGSILEYKFISAEMLHLKRDAGSYSYLSQSGCSSLVAVSDKEEFNTTVVSIKCLHA